MTIIIIKPITMELPARIMPTDTALFNCLEDPNMDYCFVKKNTLFLP